MIKQFSSVKAKVILMIVLGIAITGLAVGLAQTSVIEIEPVDVPGDGSTLASISGEMGLVDEEGNAINTSPLGAMSWRGSTVSRVYFWFEVNMYGENVDWSSLKVIYILYMSWPGKSATETGMEDTLYKGDIPTTGTNQRGKQVMAERNLADCFSDIGVSPGVGWREDVTFTLDVRIEIKDTDGKVMAGNQSYGWFFDSKFIAEGLSYESEGVSGAVFDVVVIFDPKARVE